MFLARHFCRDRWLTAPLNRPESFELHAHKRYTPPTLPHFVINSWIRAKTGHLGQEPERIPIVLVEQDLNTIPEEASSRDFSASDITDFLRTVPPELESILLLYFPLGGD
jgi:hypothetical protein